MLDQIEINPRICGGKPVVRDTRIPVTVILDHLAVGESWDSILKGFPELRRKDIAGTLIFARQSIEHTEI